MVGIDGSPMSRVAFREAISAAQNREAEVLAVHVFHYPVSTGYQMVVADVGAAKEHAENWTRDELERLRQEYHGTFPVPVAARVSAGHVGRELRDAAFGAELLVLGSRGLGGVMGTLLGSTTTHCVHHPPCPLLIVPDDDDHDD